MKTPTHKIITGLAIKLYEEQFGKTLDEKSKLAVIQGSEDEDLANKIVRATNWHFYRDKENQKIPKRKWLVIKVTSEDILRKRIEQFEKLSRVNDFKRYNQFGRILHHIQDMSTPSHVLPIYHGPKYPIYFSIDNINDYFEEFMCNKDNQNHIVFDDIAPPLLDNNIKGFFQIYDNAAQEMLEILKDGFYRDDNTQSKKLSFSLFWKSYREKEFGKIEGFGVYGKYHEYFKNIDSYKNNDYNITRNTLLSIQKTVINHAIKNTYKAILFAKEKGYI